MIQNTCFVQFQTGQLYTSAFQFCFFFKLRVESGCKHGNKGSLYAMLNFNNIKSQAVFNTNIYDSQLWYLNWNHLIVSSIYLYINFRFKRTI